MPHPRFQISIRWSCAVTAMVGLALAALSAEPKWISSVAIQLIFLAMPGLVAILLVAGLGYVRTFAMGAAAPTLIGLVVAGRFLVAGDWTLGALEVGELARFVFRQTADVLRLLAIIIWSSTLLGGTVAVVIRLLVGVNPDDNRA